MGSCCVKTKRLFVNICNPIIDYFILTYLAVNIYIILLYSLFCLSFSFIYKSDSFDLSFFLSTGRTN